MKSTSTTRTAATGTAERCADVNIAILTGRPVADPEVKATANGTAVASYRLAVQRDFANAEGKREADFINVIAWRQSAEFAAKYIKKGVKIAVTGRIQSRSYDAQDGSKRYVTEVIADRQEFCERAESRENAPLPDAPDEMTEVDDDELPF